MESQVGGCSTARNGPRVLVEDFVGYPPWRITGGGERNKKERNAMKFTDTSRD